MQKIILLLLCTTGCHLIAAEDEEQARRIETVCNFLGKSRQEIEHELGADVWTRTVRLIDAVPGPDIPQPRTDHEEMLTDANHDDSEDDLDPAVLRDNCQQLLKECLRDCFHWLARTVRRSKQHSQ